MGEHPGDVVCVDGWAVLVYMYEVEEEELLTCHNVFESRSFCKADVALEIVEHSAVIPYRKGCKRSEEGGCHGEVVMCARW